MKTDQKMTKLCTSLFSHIKVKFWPQVFLKSLMRKHSNLGPEKLAKVWCKLKFQFWF